MVDYMDHSFELYTVATRLSQGTDGLRHDYCAGIDFAPYRILDGSGFIIISPYRILEGSEFMISVPYRRLEGSRFMDSTHYRT